MPLPALKLFPPSAGAVMAPAGSVPAGRGEMGSVWEDRLQGEFGGTQGVPLGHWKPTGDVSKPRPAALQSQL